MKLFSIFKSRDKPVTNRTAGSAYSFFMGGSSSGKNVNERTAMQMTAVYACVRILSEAIAGLPLHLYRYAEDGSKTKAIDHGLYSLLHDEPNPEMTSFVFRETLMTHLLLWGNSYAQIIRNGKGEVLALYPLMPNKMQVDRDDNGQLYYTYSRTKEEANAKDSESSVKLRPYDVLHFPGLGFDGLVGYSPIAMAKNAIGMAMACEEFGAKFFANGASPSGVLEHPGILKDPAKVRDSWNAAYGGSVNSHKVAVLEEGMKYSPISISPNEAQFLETRKFQINEIARIFRVPPHMVGDLEKSSFSNIEQQSLEFVKYSSVMPFDETGRRESRTKGDMLDRTRYPWLKNRESLNPEQRSRLDEPLKIDHLETVVAYNFKPRIQDMYERCGTRDDAEPVPNSLVEDLENAFSPYMKRSLPKTLRRNFYEILNYFDSKRTNAVLEGFNSVISIIKNRARGFRNMESFKNMIYFCLGQLDFPKALLMA